MFDEFGLPSTILSDNGPPFASCGLYGLSKLSVWWVKLGIKIEHIEPGCPQQNGRHERMHLTLKQETTRPPANNILQQQEKFDLFKQDFNCERPHEALNMKTPSKFYTPSSRKLPACDTPLEYPTHDTSRLITKEGKFRIGKNRVFIGRAFGGEQVGLRELSQNYWLVSFAHLDLGFFHYKTGKFTTTNPFEPEEEE